MGWQRRMRVAAGPLGASGEASNDQPVQVEMLVSGAWVDITGYTLVRDDSGNITVSSGIRDEGSQTEAGTCSLQLDNRDGRFSPRNPSSPYYGAIGRNTPIRVSVPDGMGGKSYRLWGEASEWTPNWDTSGSDVWTDLSANGILRRLAQGPAPERSVIYRAITAPRLTGLVAYWPCEDAAGATSVASALTNGSPMRFAGIPTLAAYDGFGASDPLPTLTSASLTGGVADYDDTPLTQYQVRYLLAVPTTGFNNGDVISRVRLTPAAIGNVEYLDIIYNDPPGGLGSYGGPGTIAVLPYDGEQNPLGYSGTPNISLDVRGRRLRVSMEASNNGANQNITLRVLDVDSGLTDAATMTTGANVTPVRSVALAPATLAQSVGAPGMTAGHVTVQTTVTPINDLGAAVQPSGEAAGRRIQRLCGEAGIPFDWVGDLDDTVKMGAQGKQNLLTLVQECVLADGGLLYETRSDLGLGYRTRTSLYNQDPVLTLDYPSGQLAQVPVPVEDDRYIQNKVTVSVSGASATYEETTGTLGTALPPAGVGEYGQEVTLNLASSDTATVRGQAAWRVHLGTVDEARFPQISVNLAHPSITPAMRRAILGMRIGDRVQVTNPPAWLPPDTIDQLVLGMSETITHFEHRLTFTCQPASPYSAIGYLDSTARIDTDGSQLLTAIGVSDTSIDVAPTDNPAMLWTTSTTDFPLDIRVGGEVMTVTSITGKAVDGFGRTVSGGWGTADTGQAWSTLGGSTTDYAVSGGTAQHICTTTNTLRYTVLPVATQDADLYVDWTMSANPSGDSQYVFAFARYTDATHFYFARVEVTVTGAMILTLRKRNGSETQLGTALTTTLTHSAGTWYRLRLQVIGNALKAKLWPVGNVESNRWDLTASDSDLSGTGAIGVRTLLGSASTAVLPVTISFDNLLQQNPQTFNVVRGVNDVTKPHPAGEDVRLATPTIIAL